MVVLNYTGGEINAKIVYYGPGVSGKTTNLEFIHEKTPNNAKGKMVSMKTQTDRTLFFDFLPLELGEINGYRTRFLLYTVPGQVYYNATRKLVLKGVDAVVFVADSSRSKLDENLESLRNLEQNLNEHGMSLDELPWVIQYNKRDLADAMPLAEIDARLNPLKRPAFEAVASKGTGVYETFHGIATMVYRVLKDRLERGELSTEVGDAAPSHHTESTPSTGARAAKAVAPERAAAPARASRPAPTPTQSAEPAPESLADAPAGGEFEFDDHVDLVLREVEAPAGKASPAKAAAAGPRKAPAREAVATPAPGRRPSSPAAPKAPAKPSPRTPAPSSSSAEAPVDDNLFAAIPESPFDHELGRLPALDEASIASESAREEGPDEFVTDPMRRSEPQPAPAAPSPRVEPVRELAREAVREPVREQLVREPVREPVHEPVREPVHEAHDAAEVEPRETHVAADLHITQEIREVRVAVPLVLTRAQLEGGAPIRVVLDVKIIDE
jgi:signal recognition particle receptor subunit beta